MAPPPPRDLLAAFKAALLSPTPPSPAQRVELLHGLRDAAPAFRALLSHPVEAKEVRLPDLAYFTIDDTYVQAARPGLSGMMAGLSYSGMNLGGRALQRTQAAVPGGATRLFSRFTQSSPPADGAPPPASIFGSRNLSDAEKANLYRQLRTIHNKREELYELCAAVQRNYSIPRSIGRANKELLRNLSAQVDPRPTDLLWLTFQVSRRINMILKFSAAVASVYVIATVQFSPDKE